MAPFGFAAVTQRACHDDAKGSVFGVGVSAPRVRWHGPTVDVLGASCEIIHPLGAGRRVEHPSGVLLVGDMRERLSELDADSIDACITDPPYHLTGASRGGSPRNPGTGPFGRIGIGTDRGFMNLPWDGGDVAFRPETWAAVYRVLKPGAHLLAVGGPRTYHRMVTAVEDAGFEIRDCIGWCYAQGLPKSLDVAGEIDRAAGASPAEWAAWLRQRRENLGMSREALAEAVACTPSSVRDWGEGRAREAGGVIEHILPAPSYRKRLAKVLGYPESERRVVQEATDRRDDGTIYGLGHSGDVYAGPTTDAAQQWNGWGTGLKPGWEIILVARKPLVGTVAENVLVHGTGAINGDGCRIGTDPVPINTFDDGAKPFGGGAGHPYTSRMSSGRWPTNVAFSHHSDCVQIGTAVVRAASGSGRRDDEASGQRRYVGRGGTDFAVTPGRRLGDANGNETVERWACVPDCPVRRLDDQAGTRTSGKVAGNGFAAPHGGNVYGKFADRSLHADTVIGDSGAASRFFPVFQVEDESVLYAAKAPRAERPVGPDGTRHPTIKPLALVRWLVRLVTPPGGTVLDPFLGSGSLAEAAALEGARWVGVELCDGTEGRPDYVALINQRMKRFERGESPGAPSWMRQEASGQESLFDVDDVPADDVPARRVAQMAMFDCPASEVGAKRPDGVAAPSSP